MKAQLVKPITRRMLKTHSLQAVLMLAWVNASVCPDCGGNCDAILAGLKKALLNQ